MKRITIIARDSRTVPAITPPETTEVRITNYVGRVLGPILGLSPDFPSGWYLPQHILSQLDKNMESHKPSMRAAGLQDGDFLDMVLTLRAMAQYARDINGYVVFSNLAES